MRILFAQIRLALLVVLSSSFVFAREHNTNNYFLIGDYGWLEQEETIERVANGMVRVANASKFSFDAILTLGDNLYPNGIESMNDLSSMRRALRYFKQAPLGNLPIHAALGNHDCYVDYRNEILF